jgi:hypothetical protein
MDFSSLSKDELARIVRSPLHGKGAAPASENWEEVMEELHVNRVELEM